jgi:tetratricopeptide (TPR) repeat protein
VEAGTALRTFVGSDHFRAPELIGLLPLKDLKTRKEGAQENPPYSFLVDIWALGVISYLLMTNELPFADNIALSCYVTLDIGCPNAKLEKLRASNECQDFIKQTMAPSASQRLSAAAVCCSPWVSSLPTYENKSNKCHPMADSKRTFVDTADGSDSNSEASFAVESTALWSTFMSVSSPAYESLTASQSGQLNGPTFQVPADSSSPEMTQQRRIKQAEQVSGKAVARCESSDDIPNIDYLWRKAQDYVDRSKFYLAELTYRNIFCILKEEVGTEHQQTLKAFHEIGAMLYQQNKYVEAEPILRRSLNMRRSTLPPEDPMIRTAVSHMIHVLWELDKLEDAEPMLRREVSLRKKLFGEDHVCTFNTMKDLAAVLNKLTKYAEAEVILIQVVSTASKALGISHECTLNAMSQLATVFTLSQKHEDAISTLQEAIYIRTAASLVECNEGLADIHHLGVALYSMRRYNEAEAAFRQNAVLSQKIRGIESDNATKARYWLSKAVYKLKRCDEAIAILKEVLELRRKICAPGDQFIQLCEHDLRKFRSSGNCKGETV